jgi:hypothetical protein
MTKKEIYASYDIEYQGGKIRSPYGWIAPLLINGNAKLGKGVYTWSTLPGTAEYSAVVNGEAVTVRGTCICSCSGCYAQTGFYRMQSTVNSLAVKTLIAYNHIDFMVNAIEAQIKADDIRFVRIHASGDFMSDAYIAMWRVIAIDSPACTFWSYTKNAAAENAFDDLDNVNIVKSVIPGCGYNFGTCDYILDTYNKLSAQGETPYICRCGVDDKQHCNNCKGCSVNKYVLFIEHSTAYKAVDDPAYPRLRDIIENQASAAIA